MTDQAEEMTPATTEDESGSLGGIGWALVLGGTVLAGWAFIFDVSAGPVALYGVTDRVANIDRIAIRHMMLVCGAASFVSGWVAIGAHAIKEALLKTRQNDQGLPQPAAE